MAYNNVGSLIVDQELASMPGAATVMDAAQQMANRHIGAVPVMEDGRLVGIFTERDLLNRVVATGRDPAGVSLREVMTPDPVTIAYDGGLEEALDAMLDNNFRHLPVVDDAEQVIGVISCRDIPVIYQFLRERWHSWRAGLKPAA
jgi:CBS domain-containing protein